jgi:uncharacterized protein (TIGR03086 family)
VTGDSPAHATAPLVGGVDLLERAVGYTCGTLSLVTETAMARPSPCRDWDLRALLAHMNDSITALHEATELGAVALASDDHGDYGDAERDPVSTLRNRACALIGGWTHATGRQPVSVAGQRLSAPVVTGAGAVEIAVHGWDVAAACGAARPIPSALAEALLPLAQLLVTDLDRPARFAAPLPAGPTDPPEARLLAFLGRHSSSRPCSIA